MSAASKPPSMITSAKSESDLKTNTNQPPTQATNNDAAGNLTAHQQNPEHPQTFADFQAKLKPLKVPKPPKNLQSLKFSISKEFQKPAEASESLKNLQTPEPSPKDIKDVENVDDAKVEKFLADLELPTLDDLDLYDLDEILSPQNT